MPGRSAAVSPSEKMKMNPHTKAKAQLIAVGAVALAGNLYYFLGWRNEPVDIRDRLPARFVQDGRIVRADELQGGRTRIQDPTGIRATIVVPGGIPVMVVRKELR